jgi:hypothetical protein
LWIWHGANAAAAAYSDIYKRDNQRAIIEIPSSQESQFEHTILSDDLIPVQRIEEHNNRA